MTDDKQIDPDVVRILSATPGARCKVVITLAADAKNTPPAALSTARAIEGLPGMFTAELTATDLAKIEQAEAVRAIDLDREQKALA